MKNGLNTVKKVILGMGLSLIAAGSISASTSFENFKEDGVVITRKGSSTLIYDRLSLSVTHQDEYKMKKAILGIVCKGGTNIDYELVYIYRDGVIKVNVGQDECR